MDEEIENLKKNKAKIAKFDSKLVLFFVFSLLLIIALQIFATKDYNDVSLNVVLLVVLYSAYSENKQSKIQIALLEKIENLNEKMDIYS